MKFMIGICVMSDDVVIVVSHAATHSLVVSLIRHMSILVVVVVDVDVVLFL